MTCDSNILAQVIYKDQIILELVAVVIRPKKNLEAKSAYTYRVLKKSTRAPTKESNAKLAVTGSKFFLRNRNYVFPFLIGTTSLGKRQSGITIKETLASKASVLPPTKTLHDKSSGS